MNNPCNECIVTSMCKEYCGTLILYVSKSVRTIAPLSLFYCRMVAYWTRVSKTNKEIGEIQIYIPKILVDRRLKKQANFIIREGEICDISDGPIPITVPKRKGLKYYKTGVSERVLYAGCKDIINHHGSKKYYRDFNGMWLELIPIS